MLVGFLTITVHCSLRSRLWLSKLGTSFLKLFFGRTTTVFVTLSCCMACFCLRFYSQTEVLTFFFRRSLWDMSLSWYSIYSINKILIKIKQQLMGHPCRRALLQEEPFNSPFCPCLLSDLFLIDGSCGALQRCFRFSPLCTVWLLIGSF